MIIDVKDDKLARKLLREGKANNVDLFKAYYSEEVDTRLVMVKDNTDNLFDEDAVRDYYLNYYASSDIYDEAFEALLESMINFVG